MNRNAKRLAHMNRTAPSTKIVATIGPASDSPDLLRQLIRAGMNVARLNFSHGSHEEHAGRIERIRTASQELDSPVTVLQDLQGPKVRVGKLPAGELMLADGASVSLLPVEEYHGQPHTLPVDYPQLAAEAGEGAQVLIHDGLIELRVEKAAGNALNCHVVSGGTVKSRAGVVLPNVELSIASLTDKDRRDLEFGIARQVDWIALSFVRRAEDVQALKTLLARKQAPIPVIAKIETPQAVANLEAILDVADGVMVARGDLGVEMSPEKVPLAQKRIIRACNERGIPVITATQMLESMIAEPRPTRAEASDVANAILDGSDCVMLSGESAVGKYPVRAVEMMARIAREVEPHANWTNHPPDQDDDTHALAQAINAIDRTLPLRYIVAFTRSGFTARLVAAERPRAAVLALTPEPRTIHAVNLVWGVKPVLTHKEAAALEELLSLTETTLLSKGLAKPGDKVLLVAGMPPAATPGANLIKLHTLRGDAAKGA
jgi:pyruvate kinase